MTKVKRLASGFDTMFADAKTMAAILGISVSQLNSYVAKGAVTRHKNDAKLPFNVQDTIHAYTDRMREQAAGRSGGGGDFDLVSERARETYHKANLAEIKAAQARKEVISKRLIITAWASVITTAKSKLLSLGSRLRRDLPELSDDHIAIIDKEVHSILENLSAGGDVAVQRALKGLEDE